MSNDGFGEFSSERPTEAREEKRAISIEEVTRIARDAATQVFSQMLPEVVRTVLETQRQSSRHSVAPSHQDFEMDAFDHSVKEEIDFDFDYPVSNPKPKPQSFNRSNESSQNSSQGVPRNFPTKPGGSGGPQKKKGRFNKCFLCSTDDHAPADCITVTSRAVRENRLKSANRCLVCFKWFGHHPQTNCYKQNCPICGELGHGYGLCPQNHNTTP